jgi:dihydrolipoamide dehydrogenase
MDYDLAVIGGGPGGYTCALRAADLGLTAALVEKRELGGTCLNRGCIPTKALLRSSGIYELARRSEEFGVEVKDLSFDLDAIHKRKDEIVNKLRSGVEFLLNRKGVKIIGGRGKLLDQTTVEIESKGEKERINAKNIMIATGSEPALLFNPDGKSVLTSDHALELKEIPKSMVVIGAGPTGVEFSTYFSTFGTEITLVEMMETVLPQLCITDPKTAVLHRRNLRRRGIDVRVGTRIEEIEVKDRGRVLSRLSDGEEVESEKVLVSIGRRLNTQDLGLEELGIKMEKGRIRVNKRMETSVPHIYAIGDVVGGLMLAHEAEREGEVAAEAIAGLDSEMDYRVVPSVVFSRPEFACVGLTEYQAKADGYDPVVGECYYASNGKALAEGEKDGFLRVVTDSKKGEIVGAQISGEGASIIISEVATAMKNGLRVDQIAHTVHPHPTLSEILMEACKNAVGK